MAFNRPWTWPPGIIFDFPTAYSEIRDKLGHQLEPSQRLAALHGVISDWYLGERPIGGLFLGQESSDFSLMFIQIRFLDTLWMNLCESGRSKFGE
jgi:hypothetical protein